MFQKFIQNKVALVSSVIILIVVIAGTIIFVASNSSKSTTDSSSANSCGNSLNTTTSSGLKIEDLKVGCAKEAKTGSKISVNYLGTLENGTKFDSSYDRNQPFTFTIGAKQVIAGWEEGTIGMKEGGKRKLIIPSNLAYGDKAVGAVIPAKAILVFEIELMQVQ